MMLRSKITASFALLVASASVVSAKPVTLGADYMIDVVGVAAPDVDDRLYYLDNLDIVADIDLSEAIGWHGAAAHIDILNNFGAEPNDRAATLQGINNIAVASQRLRLFEAWIEQSLGDATSVRIGLYDLNSEFYSNAAAQYLIAPAFGVGSEIAATGPNGPSIFPSTALGLRIEHRVGERFVARAAVLNAHVRTLGDVRGVDWSFDDGALMIGELGLEGRIRTVLGGWAYSKRHEDLRDVDATGAPVRRRAHGGYLLVEWQLAQDKAGPQTSLFARAGASDGTTTPYKGGWQAGLLVERPFAARPESLFSIGVNQALLSGRYRANLQDSGIGSVSAESALELTYADRLAPFLTVQPDLQIVFKPGGESARRTLFAGGVRVTISL